MKANVLIGVTLATLLGWGSAADAQIQRWVDEKGRVHYSNTRPVRPAPPEGSKPAKPSEPETLKGPETVERAEPKTSTPAAQARPDQRALTEDALQGTGTKKQERMGGVPMLTGITISGIVLILIGSIWLIVEGFKQSVLWGLGLVVFFQFIFPLFTYMHWQESKRPVLVFFAGGALCVIGVLMVLMA